MSDAKWERLALLGGPVFIVLVIVGAFLPGAPPAPDDPAQEVFDYFSDNAGLLQFGAALGSIATIFAVFWAGSVWRAMRRAEGGEPRLTVVAALGFVLAGAMALVAQAVNGALSLRVGSLDPEGAQLLWTLSSTVGAAVFAGIAVQLVAVGLLALRTRFVSTWLAVFSLLVAALFVLATPGIGSDDTVWFDFGFTAFLSWSLWLLVFTWQLWKIAPVDEVPA